MTLNFGKFELVSNNYEIQKSIGDTTKKSDTYTLILCILNDEILRPLKPYPSCLISMFSTFQNFLFEKNVGVQQM